MEAIIFHLSLPAADLQATEQFYCTLLGARRGRSTGEWVDLFLFGHQVTFHRRPEQVVAVAGDTVQHFGAILPWDAWQSLCRRIEAEAYPMELAPTVYAAGREAEHAKVVLRDPSGHRVELKAYRNLATVLPAGMPGDPPAPPAS